MVLKIGSWALKQTSSYLLISIQPGMIQSPRQKWICVILLKSQWPFYYLTKSPHFLNIKVSKWLKITDKLWGVRLNWALMSTHLDGLANLLSITWSPSILKSILKATATKFLENTRTYFVLLYPFPATKVSGIWETIQSNILVLIGQSHRDWTEIRLIVSTWNT